MWNSSMLKKANKLKNQFNKKIEQFHIRPIKDKQIKRLAFNRKVKQFHIENFKTK